MKPAHLFYTVLTLMVGAAFVYLIVQSREGRRLSQRYDSTCKTHLDAISYVARVNYQRVLYPDRPVKDLMPVGYSGPPEGFTVRHIHWSERTQAPWLKGADFVVEQTAPPYLVITSTGSLFHIPPPQPGAPAVMPAEWNPHPAPAPAPVGAGAP